MELRQLQAFATVARLQHLTRAAERLHLSQPAVSHQIKALEEELGVRLFERTAGGLLLAAAGRELLPQAETILAATGTLMTRARSLRGEVVGTVRLGTIIDPTFTRLGELLRRLTESYPRLTVETRHSSSGLVREGVRRGELDAGYCIGPAPRAGDGQDVAALALGPMRYVVVAPAAWRERVLTAGWAELARLPWIGSPPFSSQTHLRREMFAARGLGPATLVQETDQESSRRSLVAAGVGMGLMREDLAIEAARAGELVIWPEHVAHTTLWLIHLAARAADPPLAALRGIMRELWPEGLETTAPSPGDAEC